MQGAGDSIDGGLEFPSPFGVMEFEPSTLKNAQIEYMFPSPFGVMEFEQNDS